MGRLSLETYPLPVVTESMSLRRKILVCAYGCNPRRGSEGAVGWGWSEAISRHHDLWVITAERERADIEAELARRPELRERMHFSYVPRRRWLWLERLWPPAYLWSYRLQWQPAAYEVARRLHEEIAFDLAHQLTYVAFRVPGHLWKLDIPFVWGPIGALENTPWRLLPTMGLKGALHFAGRNLFNSLHKRFLPAPKRAFRKARGGIIAATDGVRREIARWYGEASDVICEVGLPPSVAVEPSRRQPGEPLRLAWSGLHQPAKALPLLLQAAADLPRRVTWELDILGQGPCTAKWKRLARRLGIADRCRWHGWVAREDALAVVRNAHVFTITSLKELTSTVLLEALAQGVPVVCPDHCGFSDVIRENCGMKLPIPTPKRFQEELGRAITRLANDEPLRHRLAAGALERAADFSWETKAKLVDRIYRRVLDDAQIASECRNPTSETTPTLGINVS